MSAVVSAVVSRQFDLLDDPDPAVRAQARFDLMGLPADQLESLSELIRRRKTVWPAQAFALHDIVLHVFLAGQGYTNMTGAQTTVAGVGGPYFIGIRWKNDNVTEDPRIGAPVDSLIPGFPGFRSLRAGDMILGVYLDPSKSLFEYPNLRTNTRVQIGAALGNIPNAKLITLQVLRDGQEVKVPISMAPRPASSSVDPDSFNADRMQQAEVYWQGHFEPFVYPKEDQQPK